PAAGARLVYVGHYPHYPNEEAVVRFCRRILPRIRRRRPDATFAIVGSSPTEAVLRAARETPGVSVTGTVPDVRPHLAEAAVFVAPIRLGRGIKGKVLEAFAMGLPVVASPLAAEGLGARPGRELLAARGDAAFADAVVALLDSPARRAELGAAGRRFAVERCDWNRLAQGLGDVYDELL
ncbi:MAG: glycosyltransferase, partial [Elusimicrobia bacterium]|nr:glycosyltransferase [Elusimicrobiota bacterium]